MDFIDKLIVLTLLGGMIGALSAYLSKRAKGRRR